MNPKSTIRFLDFEFDPESSELRGCGRVVRLPEKPALALVALIERANQTVSRAELCERLWPQGTFVEFEGNLNATIKRLREALGDSAEAPRLIQTVPRSGYRFIAAIEAVPREGQAETDPILRTSAVAQAHRAAFFSHWKRRAVLAGAALLAVTMAGLFGLHEGPGIRQKPASGMKLAVVSFDNLTGDPAKNFLSNGLFDEVTASLRRLSPEQLTLISYERPKGAAVPYEPAISQDAGVRFILRGAVENEDGNLSLVTNLVDAHSSARVWSMVFKLPLQEVFVRHDLAARVAGTLSLKSAVANRQQLSRTSTSNAGALEAYLRGRESLRQDTTTAAQAALELFQKALDIDPQYALPYSGMAQAYLRLAKAHALPHGEGERQAQKAIDAGMRLDPMIADFSVLKAMILAAEPGRDHEAESAYRRALELDPSDVMARAHYALFLRERRAESSLAEITKARSLAPQSAWINAYEGSILISCGRLEAADTQLRRALQLDPTLPDTLRFLGDLEQKRGRAEDATLWYEKAARVSGRNPFYVYRLGLAYARSGRDVGTKAALLELRTRSTHEFIEPTYIRDLEAALGG